MGEREAAVDCVMLGGVRAHMNMDPDPKRVTKNFPRTVSMPKARATTGDGAGALPAFPEASAFGAFVLEALKMTYPPYLLANADAQSVGAKAFYANIYGEDVSVQSRPSPERSRNMIIDSIQHTLLDEEAAAVRHDPVNISANRLWCVQVVVLATLVTTVLATLSTTFPTIRLLD